MTHYICTGDCKGVSDKPGTCQAVACIKHDEPLIECHCVDNQHQEVMKKKDIANDESTEEIL